MAEVADDLAILLMEVSDAHLESLLTSCAGRVREVAGKEKTRRELASVHDAIVRSLPPGWSVSRDDYPVMRLADIPCAAP